MDLRSEQQAQAEAQSAQLKPTGLENGGVKPPPLPAVPQSPFQSFQYRLVTPIDTTYATLPMLLCCLISGLVDSTIYNAYGTFVSMQTGNTIFLGLGGATSYRQPPNPKPYGWAKSMLSMVCFFVGCFFFSQFTRRLGPLLRGTLVASFFLQALLILIAAAAIESNAVDGNLATLPSDVDWRTLIPIALLSFQSSGQIIGSRTLGLAEIPSVVLTSMLCDIASDPNLTVGWKENKKRNRRSMAFLAILVGAVIGGFISEGSGKVQVVLWIAGGLKVGIVGAWLLWPGSGDGVV